AGRPHCTGTAAATAAVGAAPGAGSPHPAARVPRLAPLAKPGLGDHRPGHAARTRSGGGASPGIIGALAAWRVVDTAGPAPRTDPRNRAAAAILVAGATATDT